MPASAAGTSRDKAFLFVALLLAALTASIVAMAIFGFETLSQVRIYVGGGGRWAVAQKDAVLHLRRYAETGDEADYQRFLQRLAVPQADRTALEEIVKPHPDLDVIRRALVVGEVETDDVAGVMRLYHTFQSDPRFLRTIQIWVESNREIDAMEQLGERLHRAFASGRPDPAEVRSALERLREVDARASKEERDFARDLSATARDYQRLLSEIIALAALVLLAGAVWLASALLRRVRRGEAEAQQSQAVYRSLVEQAPIGIFRSTPDGRIVAANPALVSMLGYGSESELLEKRLARDLYADPADRERLVRAMQRPEAQTAEVLWRRKDGRPITVRLTGRATMSAAGKPEYFSTLIEDVTLVRGLEEQLRQAQRMEAIGQLASGVAHDFNNLLAAILGSAEILLEELPEGHAGREDANEIRQSALRAAGLTRQLLAFGRKQALAPRLLSLNDLLEGMRKLLQGLVGEDIQLELKLAQDLGAVHADRGQLEQVVMNLAVNARDAMPGGGTLTVATSNEDLETQLEARQAGVARGRYAVLTVRDTGCGMDAATQQRIFEPFFSTKREKGSGLGLATAYGIVQQSGGSIRVQSAPGRGSTFRIYLPRVEGKVEEVRQDALAAEGGDETLLLVEDREEVRATVRKLLEGRGYRVLCAGNGPEALLLATQHNGDIHALVTDVSMPGMTGPEVARELARTRPQLRCLFLSGYSSEQLPAQAGRAFLPKPFTSEDLARKIREVLDAPAA